MLANTLLLVLLLIMNYNIGTAYSCNGSSIDRRPRRNTKWCRPLEGSHRPVRPHLCFQFVLAGGVRGLQLKSTA